VGLYAEFLQYENADYKAVFPVVENNVVSSSAEVRLTGNTMRLLD
jgi:type VI secretion system protein VasD